MFDRQPCTSSDTIMAIDKDLAKAARRSGGPAYDMHALQKVDEYPHLVPVLVDWLDNLEARTTLPEHDLGIVYDTLFRVLMTDSAPADHVTTKALDYLDSHPPVRQLIMQGASLAAGYHAAEKHLSRMIATAKDRTNGNGRVWLFEWLIKTKNDEAILAAAHELDDPSVQSSLLRDLTKLRAWPAGVREAVENLDVAYDKQSQRRKEQLLAKMDKYA